MRGIKKNMMLMMLMIIRTGGNSEKEEKQEEEEMENERRETREKDEGGEEEEEEEKQNTFKEKLDVNILNWAWFWAMCLQAIGTIMGPFVAMTCRISRDQNLFPSPVFLMLGCRSNLPYRGAPPPKGKKWALDVVQHCWPVLEGSSGPFFNHVRGSTKRAKIQRKKIAEITLSIVASWKSTDFYAKPPKLERHNFCREARKLETCFPHKNADIGK